MSFIQDKASNFTKSVLPCTFSEPAKSSQGSVADLVVSYLPKAFDVLTRWIGTDEVRQQVVEAVPRVPRLVVDLTLSYVDNRAVMLRLLDELPNRDKVIGSFMKSVDQEQWSDLLFSRRDLDLYLLEAVRRGLLTQSEFTTYSLMLMAPKTAQRAPFILPFLGRDGEVNKLAEKLVKESFLLKKADCLPPNAPASLLSEAEFGKFTQELRHYPRVEQMLPLIPFAGQKTVIESIHKLGLNIFGKVAFPQMVHSSFFGRRVTLNFTHSLIVAPMGMVHALLQTKFGQNAVEMLPAIGPVPEAELRQNGLYGTRVVSVDSSLLTHLTGLQFPTVADGFDAPGVYFPYHDMCYHGYVCSSVPHALRQRYIQFGDLFVQNKQLILSGERQQKRALFFEKFSFKFPDMELIMMRPEIFSERTGKYRQDLGAFWSSCAEHLSWTTTAMKESPIAVDCMKQFCSLLVAANLITDADREAVRLEVERTEAIPSDWDLLEVLRVMMQTFHKTV